MRFIHFYFAAFLCAASFVVPTQAKNIDASLEESLALRRISEYWKERDYKTAKAQIESFLSRKPESRFADRLWSMLGDLHFREKNYAAAVEAYDHIDAQEFRNKTLFHRLHGLYEIGKYEEFIGSADFFVKNPTSKADEIQTIYFELGESYSAAAFASSGEKREELLQNAVHAYNQVLQTHYCDQVLAPLARAYALLEEYPKAVSAYLALAQKEPEKKEEWLFQAGALQLHCHKPAAIQTFGKIVEMGGKHAPKAAFNQLCLLFQEKRYQDFILAYDSSIKHVPKEEVVLMRYFLGQSLFQKKDFAKAAVPLMESLESGRLDRSQEKNALIALVGCAKAEGDLGLFEKALSRLKKGFAEHEETFNSGLMLAQLLQEKQQWSKARGEIQELIQNFPRHPQKMALVYDEALLLAKEGKWTESAEAFQVYLEEYPKSEHAPNVMRHLVHCRQEDLKQAPAESEKIKKQLLLEALETALAEPKAFPTAEKPKLRYLTGKLQYELGQYEEAIETLSSYLVDFGTDASCANACLLLAYSHLEGFKDAMQFVLNAERALAYNPSLEGASDVRLVLFNTYLELAEKAPLEEKKEMIAKAADHLYFALDKSVSKENQKWLSAYYFQQYQKGQVGAAHKTAHVLEHLLGIGKEQIALSIDAGSLDKEGEAIKLASLYDQMGRFPQRLALLQALIQEHSAHPELHWKYQRMAEFELGKTHLCLSEKQKALDAFTHLIETSHISSYYSIAAELEKAKLEFSMLDEPTDHAVVSICDALKDVQTKRKLLSEPLHLEAALTYVDIKTALAEPDDKLECRQFYLERMRENFSSTEDPLVEQYLAAAAQFPDQEILFWQYLAFVDAQILQLEAQITNSQALRTEAKERFDRLLAEAGDATLKERIHKSMEALNDI